MRTTMTLREVQAHTLRELTLEDAYRFVSRGQSRQFTHNQALALSLHTWHNTHADWLRLQACLVILKQRRG